MLSGCGNETLQSIFQQPTNVNVPPPQPPQVPPAFIQPQEIRSVGTTLDTSLTLVRADHVLNGANINVRTYNGTLGGPTLRCRPGDRLRVNVINQLPANPDQGMVIADHNVPHHFNSTNLHTHGLHVSPQGNSDNVFVDIQPGQSFQYEYQIPANHPAGTFWYHPHKHGSSSMQLFSGMAGALIIEGDIDLVPEIAAARDLVYLITEFNLSGGDVPAFVGASFPLNQRTLAVNGVFQPTLQAFSGEVVRLRVINGTVRTNIPFAVEGHDLNIISFDGLTLPNVRQAGSTLTAPGNRVDILVQAGAPGLYEIRKLVDNSNNAPDAQLVLGFLEVLPTVVNMSLPGALPAPAALPTIEAGEVTGNRTLTFSVGAGGPLGFGSFEIDGVLFDENVVNQTVNLGAVEEWKLVNTSNVAHPFHIHVNAFQVISINGVALPEPEWRDTILIPKNGEVVIRHRFEDFTGVFVLHCHILVHEDIGMMQVVEVV